VVIGADVKGRTIRDIPPTIHLEIKDDSSQTVWAGNVSLQIGYFTKSLTLYPIKDDLNILLFGLAGATKSSFVNSILTLLSREMKIINSAAYGGGDRHATTSFGRYRLSNAIPKLKVNLWDTWGLTPKTYQGNELEDIIGGRIPNGFKMLEAVDGCADKIKLYSGTAESRRIDCVLFFIPQGALTDPSQEPIRRAIGFFFAKFVHNGYNPMLMLTRVDEINESVRQNTSQVYKELEELKDKASKLLNIPPLSIFYNVNYVKEIEKTFEIDRLNFLILDEAIRRSLDRRKYITSSRIDDP